MKDSYLIAGMRFRPLVRLLARNRITLTPRNIARILFLVQSSCWSSLFSRIEKSRYRAKMEGTPVPLDPVFIVGHWRTGSTLLHQLMSQDPELAVPTLFQVALPENFLVSYRFYKPILSALMGTSRPMDNVKIGMDEPQEDEYAIFRMTTRSPLERLIFPVNKEYFVNCAAFLPSGEELKNYEKQLKEFYRKLRFATGRRIVSKNPFNSLRISMLYRLFPDARFIHIVRHPYEVAPSTRHLWHVVQGQNILNRNRYTPEIPEISLFIKQVMEIIDAEFRQIPLQQRSVIRYEDLVSEPVRHIQYLYEALSLPFNEKFRFRMESYLNTLSGYTRNSYNLNDEEKRVISGTLSEQMERYAYSEKG